MVATVSFNYAYYDNDDKLSIPKYMCTYIYLKFKEISLKIRNLTVYYKTNSKNK